ncbi:MAG: hypothetical protein CSA89_00185 [Bacteroidales bacterium]|nr:MAG: hypothetical protein CSA89_00185 [Bacteroidales bacterium]
MNIKLTKELKIGITFVVTVMLLFFGLNYLKGINIFTSEKKYYAVFDDIDGLVVSNSVCIKGYKVGQIRHIRYDFAKENPFLVELAINKDIKLPQGSVFVLTDDGLVGGKMINIKLTQSGLYYKDGDTITSDKEAGFMAKINNFVPSMEHILNNVDSMTRHFNDLVANSNLEQTINSLGSTMNNLNATIIQIRQATANLPSTMNNIDNLTGSLNDKVATIDIEAMTNRLQSSLNELEKFMQQLNNSESSLGLLMNDKAVYDKLNKTIENANSLVIDLKENPKRYVHFSVFGGKK